jgi:hypothetical protein
MKDICLRILEMIEWSNLPLVNGVWTVRGSYQYLMPMSLDSVLSGGSHGLVVSISWFYYWFSHCLCVILGKLFSLLENQFPYVESKSETTSWHRKLLTDPHRVIAKNQKMEFIIYHWQKSPPQNPWNHRKTFQMNFEYLPTDQGRGEKRRD